MKKTIVIVGCGYVGLTLGVTLAAKGCEVVFIEKDDEKRRKLGHKKAHFFKQGMDQLINKIYQDRDPPIYSSIESAIDNETLISAETIVCITLGTPFALESETTDTSQIFNIFTELERLSFCKATYMLRSTVNIGFTSLLQKRFPWIEDLAFCPERTVEGKALKELLVLPQIIASSNEKTRKEIEVMFMQLGVSCLQAESFEVAEAVKLINNTYRDFKFAFSNICSDLCHHHAISSADVMRLANTSYPRSEIPSPGLVGGPCLEKDPHILTSQINSIGAFLVKSARNYNHGYPGMKLFQFDLRAKIDCSSKILLVGLAFKSSPITDDVRGSLALDVILNLKNKNVAEENITCIDPCVTEIDTFPSLQICDIDLDFNLSNYTHVIICNQYPAFLARFLQKTKDVANQARPAILSFVHVEGLVSREMDLIA